MEGRDTGWIVSAHTQEVVQTSLSQLKDSDPAVSTGHLDTYFSIHTGILAIRLPILPYCCAPRRLSISNSQVASAALNDLLDSLQKDCTALDAAVFKEAVPVLVSNVVRSHVSANWYLRLFIS